MSKNKNKNRKNKNNASARSAYLKNKSNGSAATKNTVEIGVGEPSFFVKGIGGFVFSELTGTAYHPEMVREDMSESQWRFYVVLYDLLNQHAEVHKDANKDSLCFMIMSTYFRAVAPIVAMINDKKDVETNEHGTINYRDAYVALRCIAEQLGFRLGFKLPVAA